MSKVTLAAEEDGHDPLTSKEGWRAFVDRDASMPELLPSDRWKCLGELDRERYDQARLKHHAQLVVVATPTIRQVAHLVRRLVLLNRGQFGARRGLIVTGSPATGKTTAITQVGKRHELHVRDQQTDSRECLPVVYVTVPPAATPRMLAVEFARFLGLPLPGRANQADITNAVCEVLSDLGTGLVLVDEIHNLNLHTRAGAEASDQLKYLSERIPATFVYAGVDVAAVGLFNGIRGKQLAGRFASIQTAPFPYGASAQRRDWRGVIVTLEQALTLHRHRPGALVRLDSYLYERTGGLIGSLSHLVRGAAIEAVLDGSERITKATLEAVTIDHAAEQVRPRIDARPSRGAGEVA